MDNSANDDKLPTAVIADRVAEYLYAEEGRATIVLKNEQDKKFALNFDIKMAVVLQRVCSRLIAQYHLARPDVGAFFHGSIMVDDIESQTVDVSAFNELRGVVGVQFEKSIVYILNASVAAEMASLLTKTVEHQETPEERAERLAKKHPSAIVQPRSKIIRP